MTREPVTERPRRVCRTPEDCFAAGYEDGAHDPPMTRAQRARLVALLAPHLRPDRKTA